MAILQSKEAEVRFAKRKNLEQEAKMIGDWYRDCIRMYGVDCVYHKLDTSVFENYKGNIDRNVVLQQAYGYNISPDYSLTADMLTYMDVQSDIFQLNKLGLAPDAEIDFVFDSNDFACALANKLGQYKEYKIKETEVICEVPDLNDQMIEVRDPETGEILERRYLSSDLLPYSLGLGYAETYETDILSGKLSVELYSYEYDKETTVVVHPYEHGDAKVEFPTNPYLYKSFKHHLQNDSYLETLVFLTYKVSKVQTGVGETKQPIYKSILRGRIHGAVLFYDITAMGKYMDKIHPEIGDVVCIDFPDEKNREQYEITDCYDKQLTPTGISPLLHKYVWKCKAKRYINSGEDLGEDKNQGNEQVQEKHDYAQTVEDQVGKDLTLYPNGEDAAYGGYDADRIKPTYDKQVIDPKKRQKYDIIEGDECLHLVQFGCGSRLVTDGYDLIFVDRNDEAYIVSKKLLEQRYHGACCESNLKWLKASKDCITFTTVGGESNMLVQDERANPEELELCLNSLFDKTQDEAGSLDKNGDCFIKFKNTRTYMWATGDNLFAHLESDGRLYKLV